MADFTALKTAIQTYIKQNGNEEINGEKLQEILLSVVTTLGDSAINDLITDLANEVAARQNADGTLQGNINSEITARSNADTALSNRLGSSITAENTAADQIGAEAEARAAADTALLNLIDGITDNIENGYVYAGIATPSSIPATGKVFYLALTAGTYINFGNIAVMQGINILKYNGSAWQHDAFIAINDKPIPSGTGLVKAGGTFDFVMDNGSAFDISKFFASGSTLATYENLSAALTALDGLDAAYKRGGMSIRYVQSSDNKYVRYNLLADSFTTDVTQWAIDDAGVYVDNPEFVYVKTDKDGRILWAIKTDGSIYYGAGVPQQVIDYIEEKIAELSLDEYEDIVAFLNDLEKGDKTLQTLLDEKVDKEEGKSLIDAEYANGVRYIENPEFVTVCVDSENKILFGVKADGDFCFGYGVPTQIVNYVNSHIGEITAAVATKVDKVTGKGLIQNEVAESLSVMEDPEGRREVTVDSENKIISYRDSNGMFHENVGIETNRLLLTENGMNDFQQALKNSGFNPGGTGDWTDYISKNGDNPLHLPEPRCAFLNILWNGDLTKLSKMGYTYDRTVPFPISGINCEIPCQVEYFDNDGNYFKKWVEMSGQGRSSMRYIKKNIALDFFDSEFGGDAFSVKFGDWVPQDSYHLKAYYTDFFRCVGSAVYEVAMDIFNQKEPSKNRNWKKALLSGYSIGSSTATNAAMENIKYQTENEARCVPGCFPVIVYQNGVFYGIFSWQIKKSRDNYMMKKDNPKHIHLDADHINNGTLFNGTIDWTEFEVRNPKNMVYAPNVFEKYDDTATYGTTSIVRNAEWNKVYRSMKANNTGHPLTDEKWWVQVASSCFKYNSDVTNGELAGIDNATYYDGNWTAGTYAIGRIVKHNDDYFINQVAANDKEPITVDGSGNNNTAKSPDFKNKTGCGWINCTNSVKVKNYIVSLSHRCAEIASGATDEAKKELLDTYFDYDNLIDYEIVQMITGSYDSFNSNWQWTTWDGEKWFVNDYDKDCSFGGLSYGNTILPPCLTGQYGVDFKLDNTTTSGIYAYKYTGPLRFIEEFYTQTRIDKYKELRDAGVISLNNMFNKVASWIKRLGTDYFEKEYEKWSNCMTNIATECNEGWKLHSYNTALEYRGISTYNPNTTYNAGDVCLYEYIAVEATQTVTGVTPIKSNTHQDSIYRLYTWIKERIELIDEAYNYNQN